VVNNIAQLPVSNNIAELPGIDVVGYLPEANNKWSEVFDIIKPGLTVKIKGYRQ